MAHGGVQAEVGALGGAQVGALGDGFDREGGLSAEPRRDLKLAWIALAARHQVTVLPRLALGVSKTR